MPYPLADMALNDGKLAEASLLGEGWGESGFHAGRGGPIGWIRYEPSAHICSKATAVKRSFQTHEVPMRLRRGDSERFEWHANCLGKPVEDILRPR
jgi:hypothetical protein